MSKSEKELADELYEHRNDPDEWDEEPVEIEARPKGTEVVSFRLPVDEMDALEDAANAARETLSQFIRKAVASYLQSHQAGYFTYAGPSFVFDMPLGHVTVVGSAKAHRYNLKPWWQYFGENVVVERVSINQPTEEVEEAAAG